MQTYIALTLLYDKTLIDDVDAETGQPIVRERGYIQPGQPIELDEARAEALLAVEAIAPMPAAEAPAPAGAVGSSTDQSKRRRRA